MRAHLPLLLAAALALGAVPAARAADLKDAVPGHPGLTYFELMKLVVPDLASDGKDGASGHTLVPFQHIAGKDATIAPEPAFTLTSVDVMPIPGDASRIIVLADLGASEGNVADAAVLAVFALGPKPRLLDVAGVGQDRFVGFKGKTLQMLGPRAPLIQIESGHDNSSQSYEITELIYLRADHFRLIDSVFTFGHRECSYQITQEPIVTTLKAPGPYRAVRMRVEEKTTPSDECDNQKPPRASVRNFVATWRWDARRKWFTGDTSALKRLAKANEKLF